MSGRPTADLAHDLRVLSESHSGRARDRLNEAADRLAELDARLAGCETECAMWTDRCARLSTLVERLETTDSEIETALRAELTESKESIERMVEALSFYANVGIYHGCGFKFDRPTGGFDEDFSEDHGDPFYDRPMPGKLAREALRVVTP